MPYLSEEKRIFYRVWEPEQTKATIVFLHGAGEYSGLYHRMAEYLNRDGYRVWAIDHPSHGFTPGTPEDVYDLSNLAENASSLIALACSREDSGKLILMGNSLGAVTAAYIMSTEGKPDIAGMILTSAPLNPLKNIDRLGETVMSLEPTYMDILDTDPVLARTEELDYYKLDRGMCDAADRISTQIGTWKFPVLFINGEHDVLAYPRNARIWAEKAPYGRAVTVKNGHHDILNDAMFRNVYHLVSDFVFEASCEDFF